MFFVGLVIFGILLFLLTKPKNNTSSSPINIDKDTLGNMVGVYLRTKNITEIQEAIKMHLTLLDQVNIARKAWAKATIWDDITSGGRLEIFWNAPLSMIAHRSQVIAKETRCDEHLLNQLGQEIYFLYLLKCTLYLINNPQFQPMVNTPKSYALEKRTSKYVK